MGVNIGPGITIEGGISIVIDEGVPYNTVAPVISVQTPNVRVGKTLTSTTGTWTGSYPTLGYYYQWLDNGSNIANATANTYVVQSSDLGNYLSSNVIAYSSYGNSLPATSNTLGPVLPAIVAPTIGDFVYGGYYAGTVTSGSVQYYLIVAPKSTESQGNYLTAYAAVNTLSINGYSDWQLPHGTSSSTPISQGTGYDIPTTMGIAASSGTWPSSQTYYTTPTSGRINYWTNVGPTLPYPPNSTLVQTYWFYNGTYNSGYASNTTFSYRGVRFEPVPT